MLRNECRVALLGFPNHANVGDSAIWLGTIACLRSLGMAGPDYACDHATYSRQRLAKRVGAGTILLGGGGNFGDLWEAHQYFREQVIGDFPDNPIIQLPQSIHFRHGAALARARGVVDGHPQLTLLVREQRSLDIARNEFRASSILCPDMAFCLGPLPRPVAPTTEVVWLARTDLESAHPAALPGSAGIAPVDWLTEHAPALLLMRQLGRTRIFRTRGLRWLYEPLSWTYDWLARQRLRRGCRMLAAGRAVITDRLHGHILCLLLGIPHVLLDNSYGKVRSFYDTWTQGCELTRWCERPDEALHVAEELRQASGVRAGRAR